MIFSFLSCADSDGIVSVSIQERWRLIPATWRHWWVDVFEGDDLDDEQEPVFMDLTMEKEELDAAIKELSWLRLARSMDKHLAYPEVRCPWGCSEFLHKTNKLLLKDFLWYYTNYQMPCLRAPEGKHWTDFISPSYPSCCMILERFKCTPALAMTHDGPVVLCCRNHSSSSTSAYLHVPESPTGTIYTPNSNGFAPVTIRSRTNRSFKRNTFSDTFCSVKQVGGFGGVDSSYVTSCSMSGKADSLSCKRDSLCIQGRPDIQAQLRDRSVDCRDRSFIPSGSVERILRLSHLRYPKPSELPECTTSTYIECDSAVRLQEQVYGEGSMTLNVYRSQDEDDCRMKLFHPPWPTYFVRVHRTDGYGERFHRVMHQHFGIWKLLCITGRVSDVWENLAVSVKDNRNWIGHWLKYAASHLGFPGRRRCDPAIFPSHDQVNVIRLITSHLGTNVLLEEALQDADAMSLLFASCNVIHVVDGYFSELEYSDEELAGWQVILCVNPEFHRTDVSDFGQLFELRCMLAAEPGKGRSHWNMHVRHAGQKFWVQRGTAHPCRCDYNRDLDEDAWDHAQIAVFCRRKKADPDSLRRRYLNVIGGQSEVFCDIHRCPLILNYCNKRSNSLHPCVCCSDDLFFDLAVNEQHGCRCGQFGAYLCPDFHECGTAICTQHVGQSKQLYLSGTEATAVVYLSKSRCYLCNDPGNDDGALVVDIPPEMVQILPESLGPTDAHEIPQDIIDRCESNDRMEWGDTGDGGSDSNSDSNSEDLCSEDGDPRNDDSNDHANGPLRPPEQYGTDTSLSLLYEGTQTDAFGETNELLHGSEKDHFDMTNILTTTTGTDQREVDVEHFDAAGNSIPLCVLFNQLGHLLTRTGHKIRMNKKHRHLCERLVAKNRSKVIPLVYAEGQLFGDIFWQSLDDGAIAGAMPTALWTDEQTLRRMGIASMREHAKHRLTNPALLTSVDPAYHFMLLDQLSNLGARGKHTRLVLQRGFADHQGKDGVTFREKSDSAELYGETCENHANVHKLSALVRERSPHFFYTQTCNQKTCRGLRILRDWVESVEAQIFLHKKYGLEFDEASRYLRESAATYASRSWNEVIDLWMRYIIYSPEEPLGPIDYAWYRKEFQDTEGNLSHIHAILRLLFDVDNPQELQIVLNKIRGCIKELISHDEYEDMKDRGFISSADHLYDIMQQAKTYLTHKCGLRCQIPRMTDNGETFFVCKVQNNYYRTLTPQVHTIASVSVSHTADAKAIYNRLGMMDGDRVIERCIVSEFHVPVCSSEDPKFSPTNGQLFACYPSSQNLQFTTGHTISSYLVKYVAQLDDVARAIVKPPGRDKRSCAKVVIEQLHNTKIASNKIRATETKNKHQNYGRVINHTECISVLLADPLVTSTVEFVHYSTCPREYRPAVIKCSQPRSLELQDYIAKAAVIGQEVRRRVGLDLSREPHRFFSADQLMVIFDERSSSLSSDAITQFSMRPPELRFVNIVPLYTRWFHKVSTGLQENRDLDKVRADLILRLDKDVLKCQWIDGMNNQIVMRRGAVRELVEYATECEDEFFGGASMKKQMLGLFLQLQKLQQQFDCNYMAGDNQHTMQLRSKTVASSKWQYDRMSEFFFSPDKSTNLPTPWTTPVFPRNRGRFLVHILLMFGRFETEYGLMAQQSMKDAYIYAGLFNSDDRHQSVDLLLARYVRECLCFQSGSEYLHDRNLVFAQAAFFECLLDLDSDAIMGTPCVLQSAMQEETTRKVNEQKQKLLASFISALYGELTDCCFSAAYLPNRQALQDMHLCPTPLRSGNIGIGTIGDIQYPFPPPYDPAGVQTRASYEEQKRVLLMAKKMIDRYCNGYSHKNLVVCGGPGNGKTTVCEEICLYALSRGLKGISTSIVADRSKALGGMHIHLLCSLQASDRNGLSPGKAAEAAVAHIHRRPELLHFWRELQFVYIDELGAVSSEMLATMDIIARHVKDSSRFMGGMLVICSMDVFQLLPIDGTALMLSMNMMTEFNFTELTESVRAAKDPMLRRLCNLTRTKEWTPEKEAEFRNIITTCCSFLSSFDDPNLPADGCYVFGRKAPCQKIEDLLINRMERQKNVQLVISKAQDEESSIAGNWKTATAPVSQQLSAKLKRKQDLCLYEKGRYEFTYNSNGNFQQGQLAILLSVNKEAVENRLDIEFFKAPPGCKEFPPIENFERDYLINHGWETVMVPFETSKTKRIRGRLVGRRTQYGVRLRIASTIHASQGATFCKLITAVCNNRNDHGDLNFKLWEPAQVVVLLSRTRTCSDLYFVGNKKDVVDHLLSVLQKESKFLAFITSMTRKLCSREDRSMVIDRPPIFRPCDFILDKIPGVYLLVSTRSYGYMYIGMTDNLRRRLNDHNSGRGSKFTNNNHLRPWALFGYIHGFDSQDNRRRFENNWKRHALQRRYWANTFTPMGVLDIAEDLVSYKNRYRSQDRQLRVQCCGSYELRHGAQHILVEDT